MAEEYDLTSAHSNFRSARARRRAAQAPASIHTEYAINQELDYLASSTFNGYDINQAMEPLPWDPESIDNFQPHPHPGTGGGLVSHHHDPRILPSRSPGTYFLQSFLISTSTKAPHFPFVSRSRVPCPMVEGGKVLTPHAVAA